tara:strand:+ start:128 stop:508 length:381 start_codon:yes stop_codon:yes gene_type:complete
MSIPLNTLDKNTLGRNINSIENIGLIELCFKEFENNNHFGFSRKRIAVKIQGSVTELYIFRAFGYRDKSLNKYIGIRRYHHQNDICKFIRFNPRQTVADHIIGLVKIYETENNNKNSLNIQTTYNL